MPRHPQNALIRLIRTQLITIPGFRKQETRDRTFILTPDILTPDSRYCQFLRFHSGITEWNLLLSVSIQIPNAKKSQTSQEKPVWPLFFDISKSRIVFLFTMLRSYLEDRSQKSGVRINPYSYFSGSYFWIPNPLEAGCNAKCQETSSQETGKNS